MPKSQVIWLNGAFGAGKTTVARKLASLLPGALTLDPEAIGGMLFRGIPASQRTADFQDLRTWRRLTVAAIEGVLQDHPGLLLVPMTVVARWSPLRRPFAGDSCCVCRIHARRGGRCNVSSAVRVPCKHLDSRLTWPPTTGPFPK